jgi:osmotically-inducible protein OsmY
MEPIMRSIVSPAVFLLFLGLVWTDRPALGQNRNMNLGGSMSGFSNSGTFGNRNLGGGVAGGSRSFGSGFGGSGGVGGTMPTDVGQVDSSDRFVRGSRAPGQFVGADMAEVQQFLGAVQAGAGGNRNALQGLIGAAQNRGNTANQQSNVGVGRRDPDVRTSLRVAFDYTQATPEAISRALAARLEKSQRIQTLSAVQVHLDRGTATLRGVVATEHDRALAERLTRLEAGIFRVKNELTVAPPAEAKSSQPRPEVGDAPKDKPLP